MIKRRIIYFNEKFSLNKSDAIAILNRNLLKFTPLIIINILIFQSIFFFFFQFLYYRITIA